MFCFVIMVGTKRYICLISVFSLPSIKNLFCNFLEIQTFNLGIKILLKRYYLHNPHAFGRAFKVAFDEAIKEVTIFKDRAQSNKNHADKFLLKHLKRNGN